MPGTGRNESRLNLVILARFDPANLTEETQARAAEAVRDVEGRAPGKGEVELQFLGRTVIITARSQLPQNS